MFTGTLYPYQVDAVEKIIDLRKILVAYSMGTGKTVCTIAALEELLGRREVNMVLILVPASLKWQWAQSLAKFTDLPTEEVTLRGTRLRVPTQDSCVVIDGDAKKRAEKWNIANCNLVDYTIASHGAVLNDWDQVAGLPFDAIVVDEATVIKNFAAETSKRIKRLQTPVRIALSGTPVENRPEDVFSIMQWVDANVLGRWDLFDKSFIVRNAFGAVKSYQNLHLLNGRLNRRMIRKSRLDPEVAKYLPKVAETTRLVTLDKTTERFYRAILADLQDALNELANSGGTLDLAAYYAGSASIEERSAQGKVMARLQATRLLLDHPSLLLDSAEAYHDKGPEGSAYIAELLDRAPALANLNATPKLNELEQVIAQLMAEDGVKVAVFTQYRRMLPYIAARLQKYTDMVLFHGEMKADERAAAVAAFSTDPDVRAFISTNAGGYGLDLPVAQYLVNYDLPDSRGVLDQRNTRHVRASSHHGRVYVVNLVAAGTIEERQQATLNLRGRLANSVVDGKGGGEIVNDVASLTSFIGSGRS
jgi:SNF2 family DNA or RNA helicase